MLSAHPSFTTTAATTSTTTDATTTGSFIRKIKSNHLWLKHLNSTNVNILFAVDPCEWCRDISLSIGDTWAGQCFADGEGGNCNCVCGDVFCQDGQFIDKTTCVPGGSLGKCECITLTTYTPANQVTSTESMPSETTAAPEV